MVRVFALIVFTISSIGRIYGQVPIRLIKVHTDLPYCHKSHIYLNFYYDSKAQFFGKMAVTGYRYNSDRDSLVVFNKVSKRTLFSASLRKINLDLSTEDTATYLHEKFASIIKNVHTLPPGQYKFYLTISNEADTFRSVYLYSIDSNLGPGSALHRRMLQLNEYCIANKRLRSQSVTKRLDGQRFKHQVNKLAKSHNLSAIQSEKNGKKFVNFYYQDWFAGRAELQTDTKAASALLKAQETLSATVPVNMEPGQPSIFSQFKTFKSGDASDQQISGQVDVTLNGGTGQEPGSRQDNNFSEVAAIVTVPVFSLPVQFEGFYTTQDINRQIKASYARVHYDVNKLKEGLLDNISAYNGKVAQSNARLNGADKLYSSALLNLEGRRNLLQKQLMPNLDNPVDTSGMSIGSQTLTPTIDTSGKAKAREMQEIDEKIKKYRQLLTQSQNVMHFDSAVAVKTGKINEDASYRQLSGSSKDILPDGNAKRFVSGLTSFDMGMYAHQDSKYTLSGQTVKGLSVGYDFSIFEVTGTVGQTEYVGRGGGLDKYTCYSTAVKYNVAPRNAVTLLYYTYSPNKKQQLDFYKSLNYSVPAYSDPVHIPGVLYKGKISKDVSVEGEFVTSISHGNKLDIVSSRSSLNSSAVHLSCDAAVPIVAAEFTVAMDKVGSKFENATLPLSLAGTQQIKASGKKDFFASQLSVVLDYFHLTQENVSSTATSQKMGFDVKYNNKRYPSIQIAYKPFTTFRSVVDTLSIPQRPMVGSVLTMKSAYQIKWPGKKYLRVYGLYSRNATSMDTSKYATETAQFTGTYTAGRTTSTSSFGVMNVKGSTGDTTYPTKNTFISISNDYKMSNRLIVGIGQDFGIAHFGFSRYATNMRVTLLVTKIGLQLRGRVRYTDFRIQDVPWKHILDGNLDIAYTFKSKINNKKL